MRDVYLYEDCGVLKNLLHIKDKTLLDEAEADYVTYALSISISLSGCDERTATSSGTATTGGDTDKNRRTE